MANFWINQFTNFDQYESLFSWASADPDQISQHSFFQDIQTLNGLLSKLFGSIGCVWNTFNHLKSEVKKPYNCEAVFSQYLGQTHRKVWILAHYPQTHLSIMGGGGTICSSYLLL